MCVHMYMLYMCAYIIHKCVCIYIHISFKFFFYFPPIAPFPGDSTLLLMVLTTTIVERDM